MTLSVVAVIVLASAYATYSELQTHSVETIFRLLILAVCVVISIGFFWGFFVSKVTKELLGITEFLKNYEASDVILDEEKFSIAEFGEIAVNINDMMRQIKEKNLALKDLNEHLEQNVEIKTRVLEKKNEELTNAKQQTEKALASRDKFIKDSIHEINTPLAVIQANIELMRLTGQESRYLIKMEAAAKIITNIYEDLSYFIKKDRFIIKKEVVNISEFLQERIEYFREPAIGANVNMDSALKDHLFVSFDKTQLQRVFDNNIFNAIKYTKEGGEIKISLFSDGNGKIIFEIINTALYKPDINNIFNRFYRGSDTRGGFGIGLSLVYQIAVQNGVGICCAALEDNSVWFAYAFKDYFEDAFSSHGF